MLRLFSGKKEARIISADSMQVYRGMDIGTAKPTLEERKALPHYLIDIKNPDEQYSVAEFVEKADSLCEEFYKKGVLPIVCGGTGFYIRAFLLGLPTTPASDPEKRQKLQEELLKEGQEAMWQKLFLADPESAKKIQVHDSYRVLRALEIVQTTGKPRSAFAQSPSLREKYDFSTIILERDKDVLYRRIEERVDKMFELGLEKEAKALTQKYGPENPGMQAIGYREFFEKDSEGKELSVQEIAAKIKKDSKRYAKKQIVFTRGIPGAKTIMIDGASEEKAVKEAALSLFEKIKK
ncbi:MAG: tRNA (adenosine(37)-N6)-dimethylallyltransferase MiaA [Treponema sp.]|nr:tRNA (adenosine(37)-N6)-dimethylallyltransferase MiaA [Treponema sp.]